MFPWESFWQPLVKISASPKDLVWLISAPHLSYCLLAICWNLPPDLEEPSFHLLGLDWAKSKKEQRVERKHKQSMLAEKCHQAQRNIVITDMRGYAGKGECNTLHFLFLFLILTQRYIYWFQRERKGRGEGERETERERERCKRNRNTDRLPPARAPTGGQTHNPGMCPDWESNLWPLG